MSEHSDRAHHRASLTRLSSDRPVGKGYTLAADGTLRIASRAVFVDGTAERVSLSTVGELLALVEGLNDRQALVFGVAEQPKVRITTKARLPESPGAVARTRDSFAWPRGPGVLFLDVDANHVRRRYESATELRAALVEALPGLRDAPMLVRPSSGAGICNVSTGAVLRPPGSWHAYVLVADAGDIERCGRAIFDRLWLAGHGRIVASKSGQALERGLVDSAVWQPERLVYAGPAQCGPGLERRPPGCAEFNVNAGFFDTKKVADLTADERKRLEELRAVARAEAEPELKARAAEWVEARARQREDDRPDDVPVEEWRRRVRREASAALEHGHLYPSLELRPEHGEPLTVADLLRDADKWNDQCFADPIEPDYGGGDRRIARFYRNTGTRPRINSYAHGGRSYTLGAERETLRVVAGESAALADDALAVIRQRGELFDFGDRALVRVVGDRTIEVTDIWLRDYLSRECRFVRFDRRAKAELPCNVPEDLPKTILARVGARGLNTLRAIVTQPTLRLDGTLLDTLGFDAATGILFARDGGRLAGVPQHPSLDDVRAAFRELWRPFAEFPVEGEVSRGVLLAGILTAAVRSVLPTAPAFAIDAPTAGTGKTLLAVTMAELRGERPAITPPPKDDTELCKFLFAALLGGAASIILDNWTAPIDGHEFKSLSATLTGAEVSLRVLGRHKNASVPNRALTLVTGNNLAIAADSVRRLLIVRLDAAVERPELRRFDLDPPEFVRRHRARLLGCALTILRGYQVHRAVDNDVFGPPDGRVLGSFPEWDALVRQAVVWLAQPTARGGLGCRGIGDPVEATTRTTSDDPTRNALATLLFACQERFGSASFTTADLVAVDFDDGAFDRALDAVFDGRQRGPKVLGKWLGRHRGAIVDGLRFESARDSHTRTQRWRVARAG